MAIFIRCDECGTDYDGPKSNPKGYHGLQYARLMQDAEALGWTKRGKPNFPYDDQHYCPTCSKK